MKDIITVILETVDTMPEPIPSIAILTIWLGGAYIFYASWLWFITVPLGFFFTFLYAKKAKTKITKILSAFFALMFISPSIISLLFFREIFSLTLK
ncbi:hypothetical protein Xmau_00164 [Xenorhabdus mauleonii]|uniref:Uncharacterized protein n=1 Tax=Xenorhabdus mauleonii TaxID=351675 RepID=A0A1I3N5E1_9GAMM|nr:hypothetical protein [Xenorhabdus mauleonii]PHM45776.1 hypothetical protein Xmau_00164 [Xenorhabdus mauleonii]SFJ04488.1 hypothetical protein SAMN05421680_10596 [Xenorhabdus mauleonii]